VCEGVLLEGTTIKPIKTVLASKPHLNRPAKILKKTQSSKAVKKEVESVHFLSNKCQLPLFHKGLSDLLALHYTSSASLAAPSCVKFTQALKDCGIPKEIIFQSIEFLMEKPP